MRKNPKLVRAAKAFYEFAASEGYGVLSEYTGACNKIRLVSPCGCEFEMTPSNFKQGKRFNVERHTDKPKQDLYELAEAEGYQVIGDWRGARHKIKMISPCGCEFEMTPDSFKSGYRFSVERHTDKPFQDFKNICDERGYSFDESEYKGVETKIKLTCPKGNSWLVLPYHIKSGYGCPCCATSGYKPSKVGNFYLYRWSSGEDSFLKFGVTNRKVEERIQQQQRKTTYAPTPLMATTFQDGAIPVVLERKIKTSLMTGIVGSEVFGDGFSETLEDTIENITFIKNLLGEIE